jgi:hypothetical protein
MAPPLTLARFEENTQSVALKLAPLKHAPPLRALVVPEDSPLDAKVMPVTVMSPEQ